MGLQGQRPLTILATSQHHTTSWKYFTQFKVKDLELEFPMCSFDLVSATSGVNGAIPILTNSLKCQPLTSWLR